MRNAAIYILHGLDTIHQIIEDQAENIFKIFVMFIYKCFIFEEIITKNKNTMFEYKNFKL